jgi:hypothetical protein
LTKSKKKKLKILTFVSQLELAVAKELEKCKTPTQLVAEAGYLAVEVGVTGDFGHTTTRTTKH